MTTEWKPLLTMQDVAKAQADGWEIQIQTDAGNDKYCPFKAWDGRHWNTGYLFRGRPRQPAMKKVKSLCWRFTDGDLTWRIEGMVLAYPWVRVPSEDKEFEVPV